MEKSTQSNIARVSWQQYDDDVHLLAERIKKSTVELHCIHAIPRGGMVVAVHLSHLLKLPLTENPYGTFLVVDDVSDTGSTLQEFTGKRFGRKCVLATLYIKEGTTVVPTFFTRSFKKDEWIEYPWEV